MPPERTHGMQATELQGEGTGFAQFLDRLALVVDTYRERVEDYGESREEAIEGAVEALGVELDEYAPGRAISGAVPCLSARVLPGERVARSELVRAREEGRPSFHLGTMEALVAEGEGMVVHDERTGGYYVPLDSGRPRAGGRVNALYLGVCGEGEATEVRVLVCKNGLPLVPWDNRMD